MRFQFRVLSGIIPIAIGIIVFALYRRILPVYFIADDFMLLRICAEGLLRPNIVDHVTSSWLLLESFGMYRPVSSMLFCLGYQLFGLNPSGYHVTSICLHSVNAMLVIAVANSVTCHRNIHFGYAAGLLFAIHPLHANAVAWVVAFPTILFSLLILSSLLAFFKFSDSGSFPYYILSLIAFLLALGSYDQAVIYPALLVGCDWLRKDGRIAPRKMKTLVSDYTPYVLLVVGYFVARKALFDSFFFENVTVHFIGKIMERVASYPHVLRKLIYPLFSLDPTERVLRWVFFISLAGCIVFSFRKLISRESVLMGVFVVFWTFCAAIVTEPVLEPVVGRYGYLASVGICIGLSFVIVRLLSFSREGKRYVLSGSLLLFVIFSYGRLLNQSLDSYEKAGALTTIVQQQLVSFDSTLESNEAYFIGNVPWLIVSDGYKRTNVFVPGLSDLVRPPFTEKKIPIYPFLDFSSPDEVRSIISGRNIALLTWNRQLGQVQVAALPHQEANDSPRLPYVEVLYPRDNARVKERGDNLVFVFAGGTYQKFRLTIITPMWTPMIFDAPREATVPLNQQPEKLKDKGIPEHLRHMTTEDDTLSYTLHPLFARWFKDMEAIYGDELFWWVEALDEEDRVIARSAMRSFRVER